ncbi:MAG TPA: MBL fold metallo-hydrolase [Chloroflexota bacterium]|nr:MBL fold metallo-hydrolase [Chloroflexota bacterium]
MTPDHSALVASRTFGDATVTIISDGILQAAPMISWLGVPEREARAAMPEADAAGNMAIGMNVAHVRIGDASILLDPGWGELDPSSWLVTELQGERSPGVQAGLASLGIQPEHITHVLISHAHDDHFTGGTVTVNGKRQPRYPRARYLLGRADWEGNPRRADPASEVTAHLGTLNRLGLLDLADGEYEVVPGVTMIHAPGESPGHSIMRVESRGAVFYYLGDLIHHPCEISRLDWILFERDAEARRAAHASKARLATAAAAERATLTFTHGPFPGWGRIVPDTGGFRWQYE